MLSRRGLFGAGLGLVLMPVALKAGKMPGDTYVAAGRIRRTLAGRYVFAAGYDIRVPDHVLQSSDVMRRGITIDEDIGVEFKMPADRNNFIAKPVAVRIWKLT